MLSVPNGGAIEDYDEIGYAVAVPGPSRPCPRAAPHPRIPRPIAKVNVVNAKNVHVGTKIVNVSGDNEHNVTEAQVESMPKTNAPRAVRCNCAVYACIAFLLVNGGIAIILTAILNEPPRRIDLGIHEDWYMRRHTWQPLYVDPNNTVFLRRAVPHLVIVHTGARHCTGWDDCAREVRRIQDIHRTNRRFPDIGYNFLVGGGGWIIEGCGVNIRGNFITNSDLLHWNDDAISVAFMGNYAFGFNKTDERQFENLDVVLARLVEIRVLAPGYKLLGVCQITMERSPGGNIMKNISNFRHWNDENIEKCPER